MNLEEWVHAWQRWATGADRSEEGWETDFPDWPELSAACQTEMLDSSPSPERASWVGQCWELAEEGEELADFARTELPRTLGWVRLLTSHESPTVRWQAYDVLGDAKEGVEGDLRKGFVDADAYVRRRALLAYARSHAVGEDIVKIALSDADPYVRRLAWDFAGRAGEPRVLEETRRALLADSEELVRSVVTS